MHRWATPPQQARLLPGRHLQRKLQKAGYKAKVEKWDSDSDSDVSDDEGAETIDSSLTTQQHWRWKLRRHQLNHHPWGARRRPEIPLRLGEGAEKGQAASGSCDFTRATNRGSLLVLRRGNQRHPYTQGWYPA